MLGQRQLTVARVEPVADDVVSLLLVDPEGRELPAWEPGAHLDVILPGDMVRQYSLCGEPGDTHEYRIAVLRTQDSRGGSKYVHECLDVGDELTVAGPKNHFAFIDAPRYLFIAGGIGITPIVPMVAAAAAAGKPWRLIYGGRTRTSMSFVDRLLEHGSAGEVTVVPQDVDGLPNLLKVISTSEYDTTVYCCGPEPLLEVAHTYCDRYLGPDALHVERFVSGRGAAPEDDVEPIEFEVELARGGQVLTVPVDRTLLSVVKEAVPDVLYSCQEGYCGTCETRVLAGTPEHHDEVLTREEREAGETMMICVGRARCARLVLDL